VVRCASCGEEMQLPERPSAPAPAPEPEPAPPPPPPSSGAQSEAVRPQEFRGGLAKPGQMRCPHCGEDVTGDESHCPHCNTLFDESRRDEVRDGPDWEKRARLGWWSAWWNTTKGVLFAPTKTFDGIAPLGFGPAFSYTIICGVIGGVFTTIYQALQQGLQLLFMSRVGGGRMMGQQVLIMAAVLAAYLLILPMLHIVWVLLLSGSTHVCLKIFRQKVGPFETTFRAIAYADGGAELLDVVPICGGMIGFFWGLVASVIGVARMHRINYGPAALAVLVLPALLIFGLVGAWVTMMIVVLA
jgi:hypothetical protein